MKPVSPPERVYVRLERPGRMTLFVWGMEHAGRRSEVVVPEVRARVSVGGRAAEARGIENDLRRGGGVLRRGGGARAPPGFPGRGRGGGGGWGSSAEGGEPAPVRASRGMDALEELAEALRRRLIERARTGAASAGDLGAEVHALVEAEAPALPDTERHQLVARVVRLATGLG